ncbi:MAG: 2-hydroxy-acid oxidase, partial [Clostridia bacterium]|nr:2-hydroxy-acid oxidase [Clostridia bacterium]
AFLEAIKGSTTSMDECDVVVPRNSIAEFVKRLSSISKQAGLRIRSFGHAGDGNLHIYVCRDEVPEEVWKQRLDAVMEQLYALARELDGQVSGEHGIGHAKKQFLRESLGDRQLELMRGIKAVFDPNGILNPGKII